MRRALWLCWFLASMLLPATAQAASSPLVVIIPLETTVQPVSAGFIDRGLREAARQGAAAAIIPMNTPGGLLESTRDIVHSILASPVPVIVYVSPAGSRAGSAGFFILESADVAAMAPGTNAGAAHPVVEGGHLDPIMKQKLENDAAAFLRSYAAPRGHNVQAAQDAVLQSKSYSATEAQQLGLITVIAPDTASLLRALDGKTVTRIDGRKTTLHLAGARMVTLGPSLRERILGGLTDPNLAVLMLVAGALLIYLEFNAPGTIIPGALGTLLLLTALFALDLLPLRYTAVMLLVAAAALLLLEVKVPSHGVLSFAGIVCLVVGLATLVAGPIPEMQVRLATALGLGTGFGLITAFLVRSAVRARNNKVLTGPAAMVGAIAVAQEPLVALGGAPTRGQVLVRGELWLAEAEAPAAAGAHLRVTGVRGLTLLVQAEPLARG